MEMMKSRKTSAHTRNGGGWWRQNRDERKRRLANPNDKTVGNGKTFRISHLSISQLIQWPEKLNDIIPGMINSIRFFELACALYTIDTVTEFGNKLRGKRCENVFSPRNHWAMPAKWYNNYEQENCVGAQHTIPTAYTHHNAHKTTIGKRHDNLHNN